VSAPGRTLSRPRLLAGLAALALPVVLALSGCGPAVSRAGDSDSHPAATPTPKAAVAGPELTANVEKSLAAGGKLVVSVAEGRLTSVSVASPYGAVQGSVNETGTEWVSTQERVPGATYRLVATAANDQGGVSTLDRSFTTGPAQKAITADVEPSGGATVGIGEPIVVKLSAPVTSVQGRREVERGLVVTSDQDFGEAAWYWKDATELYFRPKDFWPGHAKITVSVNFTGVHAGPGLWGAKNRTVEFSTGRAFVMTIDDKTHTMTVTSDGKVVRKVPVSMGRPGYATRSGVKTVMSHERSVRMTSASYGGADEYDEIVYYAQRLTWSGEYIHSAPWSVGSQGHANVSHGCVNVSPTNAIWLFNETQIGDPVVTTGTKRQMEPWNGTGGVWNISWDEWLTGSALG
jgi:lipoprotein-anchoring transpeptidase ErfK/SrfK